MEIVPNIPLLHRKGDKQQEERQAPTCKSCGFYENNCPFIRNNFKNYRNMVCKDYTYSVMRDQEQQEVDLEKEYERFVASDPVYSKLTNGIAGEAGIVEPK